MRILWLFTLLALSVSCHNKLPQVPGPHPELILHGGVIYTQQGGEVVQAIALQNGRVLATGDDASMRALGSKGTQFIDLGGRAVYPGFADAHGHLTGIGTAAQRLDLMGTASFGEVIELALARDQELPAGEWMEGRGWDQNDWEDSAFPTHHGLSAAISARPVVLRRVDGHALLANAAAMEAAGVDRESIAPEGGRILRDANGEPTGVFIDSAMGLITDVMPIPSADGIEAAVLAATLALHGQGITALHDAGVGQGTLDVLFRMESEGRLKLRLHEMLDGSDSALLERYFSAGPRDDSRARGLLNVRAVKLYADGALGSRGAALLEQYSDDHGNHGLVITSPEEIERISAAALAAGFQVCTHAIGDRGVRQTLDAYARAFEKASGEADDVRFRMEHAQVVHPDDFDRFADLGVIPSMQPQHQTSDMPWAEDRVGSQRIRGAYAWRRFIDAGCIVPAGSDAPVERLDVVALFCAAVTRQTLEGEPAGGWYPSQVLTRQEALNMLTIWPAQAAFREHDLGRLAPGYRADLVVFDGDLMTVDAAELKNCQPSMTIFAGKVVWQ